MVVNFTRNETVAIVKKIDIKKMCVCRVYCLFVFFFLCVCV